MTAAIHSATPAPALCVDHVVGGYGASTVVSDISISVGVGEAVALLGPNGSGKTTLLKMISGLLPTRSGSVRFGSVDVSRSSAVARARAGLCHIPEGRGVFRSLSVQQNLVMQCAPGNERDGIAIAVETFPVLGRRLRQLAGTMSGGEQQMLAMAAAYLRSPKLILVDEPSLGLAPLVVEEIFEFLRGVVEREGTSVLIVDQFIKNTLDIVQRAYVMRRGSIISEGSAKDLGQEEVFASYLG